jgi:DNA-binding transcriptional LysR family regulator
MPGDGRNQISVHDLRIRVDALALTDNGLGQFARGGSRSQKAAVDAQEVHENSSSDGLDANDDCAVSAAEQSGRMEHFVLCLQRRPAHDEQMGAHMEDLNDLVFFAKVVEHNGYSSASRILDVPKSRLSRRIALLEERLGVRLLQRTSRRLTVTPIGQLFYERCQAVISAGESAGEVVQQALAQPAGTLRVTCPITLAQVWLTPLLPRFMKAHPRVNVALTVTNRRIDVVDEGVDVAVRVRRAPFDDSSLVVRKLGQTTDILVASPEILSAAGVPRTPSDLTTWPALALPGAGDQIVWVLGRAGESCEIRIDARLVSDDMFALLRAALDGVGVALLPELICDAELMAGTLIRVLPEWGCVPSEVQATFPTRRGMLPAVRALIDFLAANPPGTL